VATDGTPAIGGALQLSYDDLPEGSQLRRTVDADGGVTISAPAGELSAAVRRSIARAAIIPASQALGLCVLIGGLLVLVAIRSNRIDHPGLRLAAVAALAALAAGLFLLSWWGEYTLHALAMQSARRESTLLYANAGRLLVETARAGTGRSFAIDTARISGIAAVVEPETGQGRLRSPRVAYLKLLLSDGTSHRLLGGHHMAELRWVAAVLSQATGVPVCTSR
jgi:hypothetical protein